MTGLKRRVARLEAFSRHMDDVVDSEQVQRVAELILGVRRNDRLPDDRPIFGRGQLTEGPLAYLINLSMEGDPAFADVGKGFGVEPGGAETNESEESDASGSGEA